MSRDDTNSKKREFARKILSACRRPDLPGELSRVFAKEIERYLRRKAIRRLRRIGGLRAEAAEDMLSWKNSGFSIHEKVCIRNGDKEGLEHLLYCCSRPALSPMRLAYSTKGNTVIYRTEV